MKMMPVAIYIVIEKDETLTAKTPRSGDAIIYGIVRGYSPDGHQYDLLSNWEVEYEDDLFEEEEDDDNDEYSYHGIKGCHINVNTRIDLVIL